MDEKKNVLMICVDQWTAQCFGRTNGNRVMSPTIDFLADNGLCFDNIYSECPICIPSRRCIMTGLSPRTHGDRVYNETMIMPKTVTLAKAFSNSGYQTFAVGKLHVYPQRDRIGFDDVILMEEGRNEFGVLDDYQIWLGENGFARDEFLHTIGNNSYDTRPWHLPERAHPTTWGTNEMMRMIKRHDPTRPAFFYMSYVAPHPPITPLQVYLDMYELDEMDLPVMDDGWSDSGSYIMKCMTEGASRYTKKQILMAKRAYYAACTHIDSQIRLLIGTLRECDLLNNTIIVFLSDHGDMLFDHGMIGKRMFYEGSSHVPLIISGVPVKGKQGVDTHRIGTLTDVMPTILELCGLPVPAGVEGASLVGKQKRPMIYGEITEGSRATRMVHDGRFKLIYYPCGNVIQLFDIQTDPFEKHNLAGREEFAETEHKLTAYLIKQLYNGDEQWADGGQLIGYPEIEYKKSVDFGMHNQRGLHWPPPQQYSNYGNTQQ